MLAKFIWEIDLVESKQCMLLLSPVSEILSARQKIGDNGGPMGDVSGKQSFPK